MAQAKHEIQISAKAMNELRDLMLTADIARRNMTLYATALLKNSDVEPSQTDRIELDVNNNRILVMDGNSAPINTVSTAGLQ